MKIISIRAILFSLVLLLLVGSMQAQQPTQPAEPCASSIAIGGESLDLSQWILSGSNLGRTAMHGDEFLMAAGRRGLFYVIEGTKDQVSIGSRASVVVRNITGAASRIGYGILFHSDPEPLRQGYAFVIDTANQRYRVTQTVRGKKLDEIDVIRWTRSAHIAPGRSANTLTVIDKGLATELYINCKLVNTVANTFAFKNGVIGLFVGTTKKIGFSGLKLEPNKSTNIR